MRGLLTTQSQNCYREQIQREMLARLTWRSRYAHLYPSSLTTSLPGPPAGSRRAAAVNTSPEKQKSVPQSSPPPPPPPPPHTDQGDDVPPLMRPASPQTRQTLYQDSSQHGRGRSLYLQRRGHIRPEEKFDFPLLSSWEYGWRLGDYTLDYRTPSHARSSVVRSTFFSRNGVLDN